MDNEHIEDEEKNTDDFTEKSDLTDDEISPEDANTEENENNEAESSDTSSDSEQEDTPEDEVINKEEEEKETSEGDENAEADSDSEDEDLDSDGADESVSDEVDSGEADEDTTDEEGVDFPAESIVEALLISAPQPRTVKQLAKAAGKKIKTKDVIEAIETLNAKYKETGRSFEIVKVNETYQIMTLPEYFSFVGKIVPKESDGRKLSPASLDTLAIIAYRQPIMRVDIETIRGVGCGQVLRNLIEVDLVKIVGKNTEVPGHPMLYGTTENFMGQFGISSLEELPNIEELKRD